MASMRAADRNDRDWTPLGAAMVCRLAYPFDGISPVYGHLFADTHLLSRGKKERRKKISANKPATATFLGWVGGALCRTYAP